MSKINFSLFAEKLKKKAFEARMEYSDVLGHVDQFVDGVISGWALAPKTPHIPVLVECMVGDKVLDPVLAIGERPDVAAANYGTSVCGFSINIKPLLFSLAPERNSRSVKIEVRAGYKNFKKIGELSISRWKAHFGIFDDVEPKKIVKMSTICAQILMRADVEIRARQRELPFLSELNDVVERPVPTCYDAVEKLVAPTTFPETLLSSQGKKLVLSNYVDQQRYRFNVNRSFRVELEDAEVDNYLHWYLNVYAPIRSWRRAPLSNQEINYLNGKSSYPAASRAMAFFLPPNMRDAGRETESFRLELAYWWAVDRAPALYVEDCLIPSWCFGLLRQSRKEFQGQTFPLNHFIERYFARNIDLHFLDLTLAQDRMLLYFYFIVLAAERPDLLRFLPTSVITSLVSAGQDLNVDLPGISGLVHEIFELLRLSEDVIPSQSLEQLISNRMFNVRTLNFNTLSNNGHRILSAALPKPRSKEMVDVQVIGPLKKASGLGQAARLSAGMIAKSGFKVSTFDFGLDNPAPEGFSSKIDSDKIQNSRINIIHLNGESVQLAYAYMPNVFDNSYNIGYFYWELDTPAACHHLSIELLDEIWVSSEYCRQIYASVTDKPVINVGMCSEGHDQGSGEESRRFARKKLSFTQDEFVFLAAFDSFSFIQRKNPIGVIRAFRAAFPDDNRMRLVLKTHNRTFVQDPQQLRIWNAVDEEIGRDERITLLDETLTYNDLRKLKSGIDCYVSLHRSEGWGFGMIEAMSSGVPVIATAYSGNMDFCTPDNCWLVDYELTYLYPDDYIFVAPGQKWAEPKLDSAVQQMRAVAYDTHERVRRAQYAAEFIQSYFSERVIATRYRDRLHQILSGPRVVLSEHASSDAQTSSENSVQSKSEENAINENQVL